MKERWSSRKFAAAMFWQLVFTLLLIAEHIKPELYYSLTMITLGGYFVANVMQGFNFNAGKKS